MAKKNSILNKSIMFVVGIAVALALVFVGLMMTNNPTLIPIIPEAISQFSGWVLVVVGALVGLGAIFSPFMKKK